MSTTTDDVPEKVTTLVAERGLGAPVDQRSNGNPFKTAVMCAVAGVVLTAVAIGLFYLAGTYWRPLMWVAIVPLVFGLCSFGYIAVFLFRGFQATYLYENGVVYVHNGSARAATWADVEKVEVLVIREGNFMAGHISAYLVHPAGQRPMRVNSVSALLGAGEHDPFGAKIMELADAAGRPIYERLIGKR
ncbi:hypothetical protein AB0F81_08840 [Actinoplanes sp. NPDC024001]|uniref:hypothetical protein n=1 Tax=Actinoplanes sp. NPDC024001 TaxID=3154598 RepID=UPI0033EEC6BE